MIEVKTQGIQDPVTREAITDLVETLNQQPILAGNWTFITVKITDVQVANRPTYLITEDLLSLILNEDGTKILV